MNYQCIRVDTHEGVTTVTLNRPQRRNALNREMITEIVALLEAVKQGTETRVIVLTGAGESFCSGADAKAFAGGAGLHPQTSPEGKRQVTRDIAFSLFTGIRNAAVPVIAMVNGDAAAGGCDLALACDIRIGSERARFIEGFVKIGLLPGTGGCWLLPRMVGLSKAAEMIFTGDPLGAEEAARLGLLSRLVPHGELQACTMELARRIAAGAPIAIRLAKMVMQRSLDLTFETSLELTATSEAIALTSEDHREGLAAFLEKRPAIFHGR